MADDEMRNLPIPQLQDHGYIFLWVTGRAMELGRECLSIWGFTTIYTLYNQIYSYKRVDELIWVKLNQVQRLIRTGRTGHWLNHGKEHCLVLFLFMVIYVVRLESKEILRIFLNFMIVMF